MATRKSNGHAKVGAPFGLLNPKVTRAVTFGVRGMSQATLEIILNQVFVND